tara:strand:+ start:2687 stop:3631 length:945 start_codon:yes stop_codon:yes gene_type:complete
MEKSIKIKSINPIKLFGVSDAFLKLVELELSVSIIYRDEAIKVKGDVVNIDKAIKVLNEMVEILNKKGSINSSSIKDLIMIIKSENIKNINYLSDSKFILYEGRKGNITPRTKGQAKAIKIIKKNDLSLLTGPAGTGKTFLSIVYGMALLDNNEIDKIILCRPAVEAGENLGFLPGDLKEKVDPYLTPLYESLEKILPQNKLKDLLLYNIIEIVPLAYMRGRTLENSFMILDEAQNSTDKQMKMFLTRLGIGSRAVITGDITQVDLKKNKYSGLIQAIHILNGIPGIGFYEFSREDVVRHSLVKSIIEAYDEKK